MIRQIFSVALVVAAFATSATAATLTATFTWGDVPDETSYSVERNDNNAGWVVQATSLAANTTQFSQAVPVALGTIICFKVKAHNNIGFTESDPSCQTPNTPTKPGSLGLSFTYTP